MSRAFVREDVAPPEPDPPPQGAFRVLWSVDPTGEDRELVNAGDDLLELIHWAAASRKGGFYQVRDDDNAVLAHID